MVAGARAVNDLRGAVARLIVERRASAGTHDELMRDNATYAEIVQSQIGEKSAA